jgi:DMSO/TMAO reductase YedYZ molybdopterin-dependent catalytic subunit
MSDDVLLADRLDGQPLSIQHGAPLRIVAPAHYGYKNVKHLNRIDFLTEGSEYNRAGYRFMDHPRARVAFEERGIGAPGWLLRIAYRPLIKSTVRRFRKAMSTIEPGPTANQK